MTGKSHFGPLYMISTQWRSEDAKNKSFFRWVVGEFTITPTPPLILGIQQWWVLTRVNKFPHSFFWIFLWLICCTGPGPSMAAGGRGATHKKKGRYWEKGQQSWWQELQHKLRLQYQKVTNVLSGKTLNSIRLHFLCYKSGSQKSSQKAWWSRQGKELFHQPARQPDQVQNTLFLCSKPWPLKHWAAHAFFSDIMLF